MWNAGLDEAQAEIKTAGENINNCRYADDTTFMAERKEKLKSLLMEVRKENENSGLKYNIQKMKIMASGPITSQQIGGKTMETVTDFIFVVPKSLQMVTAAMRLKTLAPWKKSYDQPRQHIKKQIFADKCPSSQSYGFSSNHVWISELDH